MDSEEQIFEKLRQKVDPAELRKREETLIARQAAQARKSEKRLLELISENSTLPVNINAVQIVGARRTRRSFLEQVFQPLLSPSEPLTLRDAINEAYASADRLTALDIFHSPISLYLDRPDPTDASSSPNDLSLFLSVKEKSRLILKTGTDLGNAEGSAYGNALLRNIFGGAESLNVSASLGTRTRSAYNVSLDTPLKSNPNLRFELSALSSFSQKPWASHEEVLRSGLAKFKWSSGGHKHELGYSGAWRQLTGLADNASLTVRGDAGDSFKSSISHTWICDARDNALLPSRGVLLKTLSEIAGWGPLKGDVGFWKSEVESQASVPVASGITFTAGLRGGLLYPLSIGEEQQPRPSRINDRFQLGGPTDVRGFRLGGLGPHQGPDSVGGDLYAAGGASLLFPLPRVGRESPLRLQAFVNGGRLLALKKDVDVSSSVKATVAELANGLPSLAAGLGLVYAHPAARFELNFSLPLVMRAQEETRKGLSFGIGISFL